MKKPFLVVLAVVAAINVTSFGFAQEKPEAQIIAYYFHGNFRCYTCKMMEEYAKEAIETYFKNDIEEGRIIFLPVNIDEKDNKHFIGDYQLYTRSLVLSLVKDGKEIKSENLQKIWQYARNRQQFREYVVREIEAIREGAL